MPSKPMRLLFAATTVVAVAALIAPGAALAKGKHKKKGQPSAVDVYVEQPVSAGGSQTAPPTKSGSGSSYVVPLKSKAKKQLQHKGGKDKKLLNQLATHSFDRKLAAVGNVTQPGTFNAAFDIGAGPTFLFALVLGTGLFVAVGGGLRGWRRRRTH